MKPVKLRLKIDLVSYPARAEGLVNSIKTVPEPPYNPDLAPCDFCLFPKLRGYRYEKIEEMKEAATKAIDTLIQEDFMGPSRCCWNGKTGALQLEEITSKGTKVSCVYYQ